MNQSPRNSAIRKMAPAVLAVSVIAALALMPFVRTALAQATAPRATPVPAPLSDESAKSGPEVTVLAGGCFWGIQGVFQHVNGVISAVSGYTGGGQGTASYDTVSTGSTGHAESVQITYDPSRISYGRLLTIYFSVAHDPTQLNHQDPDDGPQYRSAIFPQTAEQARIARAYIDQLTRAHSFAAPVVTTIEPNKVFYPAEAYHQNYLTLNPDYPYIAINDMPKVAALKQVFPAFYRPDAVLVPSPRSGS